MNKLASLAVTLLVVAPAPLMAVPISTLYSTGLDAAGNPASSIDAHYTVVSTGTAAQVRSPLPGSYFPNDSASQWIWQNADGTPVDTTLTFRTTFDLAGLDPLTAAIAGLWGTDNQGIDILLNGVSTGNQLLGVIVDNFSSLHAFSITSGFASGLNTLDFVIRDDGVVGAFRAKLSGSAQAIAVPEPNILPLFALGLAVLSVVAIRRAATRR